MTDPVCFIGLGLMGMPMAKRLLAAGYAVRAFDLAQAARDEISAAGGWAFESASAAAQGTSIAITMLPSSDIVREAVLGEMGVARTLTPGSLVVDMSSSAPLATRSLGEDLKAFSIALIDAPVSGGVKRAVDGSLAIMMGGNEDHVDRALPVLEHMGSRLFRAGGLGAGHAIKALNNYVSGAGTVAAIEAVKIGQAFGLEAETMLDIFNASSGQNNATQVKMKQFVLSGTFNSGFALGLMAKDIRIASDLAHALDIEAEQLESVASLWDDAAHTLGRTRDHTEIHAYLAGQAKSDIEKQ